MREGRAVTAAIALALAGLAAVHLHPAQPQLSALPDRPDRMRPELLFLTSLPIVFGEDFTLSGSGSPLLDRLNRRYRLRPIPVADAASLRGARLLLMVHPRAQPGEALVDLDGWVRGGGRVLLLADPMLEWPSSRPLGDPLRPPPGFADTGLLAHWGVRLQPPAVRGLVERRSGRRRLTLSSPGTLRAPSCELAGEATVARCAIGRGRGTVIADADLLNPDLTGAGIGDNLDAIMAELATLELPRQH